MAPLTHLPEPAIMNVVGSVTVDTIICQLHFFPNRIFVTGGTCQPRMSSVQLIVGLLIMIKLPKIPAIGVVAGGTICSKGLFVAVIFLMAGNTGGFAILILRADVTFITGGNGMEAIEGEQGKVMVKYHLFRPFFFSVTGLALFAQLSLMHIIRAMAIHATANHAAIIFFWPTMTRETCCIPVAAYERKFGVFIMGKTGFSPIALPVTCLTFHAVAALMNINCDMTVITFFGYFLFWHQ